MNGNPAIAEALVESFDGHYSNNLTCELGLALATGKSYLSYLYQVDRVTK